MSKVCTFKGGKFFRKFEGGLTSNFTEDVTSDIFLVPLKQGFSESLNLDFNIGSKVQAGEIIARNDSSVSSPVHSPVNGVITGISKKGNNDYVVIQESSQNGSFSFEKYSNNIENLNKSEIEKLLYLNGVTSLERTGIPTSYNSSIVSSQDILNIIIHNDEGNPYEIPYKTFLTPENVSKFENGIKILRKIMPNAIITYICGENSINDISDIMNLKTKYDNFVFKCIKEKYPASFDEILSSQVIEKKYPFGLSPVNIGIIVLKIQTLFFMSDAVLNNIPLIQKKIALLGCGFKNNVFVNVKIGTPLSKVLNGRIKDKKIRLIKNNIFCGELLNDDSIPIDKTFDSIIAISDDDNRSFIPFIFNMGDKSKVIDTKINGEERPCIQCGYCIDVCPVSIIPAHTYRLIESKEISSAINKGLFKCINCNLCSYVCPSKIPLSKNFKNQKDSLNKEGINAYQLNYSGFSLKGIENTKNLKNKIKKG